MKILCVRERGCSTEMGRRPSIWKELLLSFWIDVGIPVGCTLAFLALFCAGVFLVMHLCGCSTVNAVELARRDGIVSSNATEPLVNGTSALSQSMERVEQDQVIALARIKGTPVCDQARQAVEVRADWAKAFALVDQAKPLHDRLTAETKAAAPNPALIQALVVELNGVLSQLYVEIEKGRVRTTGKK